MSYERGKQILWCKSEKFHAYTYFTHFDKLCDTMHAHKLHYIFFIKVDLAHERLDYDAYNNIDKGHEFMHT